MLLWRSYERTLMAAAEEFAGRYWDKPRQVCDVVNVPGGMQFGVVDGTQTYQARFESNRAVIYWLRTAGQPAKE